MFPGLQSAAKLSVGASNRVKSVIDGAMDGNFIGPLGPLGT